MRLALEKRQSEHLLQKALVPAEYYNEPDSALKGSIDVSGNCEVKLLHPPKVAKSELHISPVSNSRTFILRSEDGAHQDPLARWRDSIMDAQVRHRFE